MPGVCEFSFLPLSLLCETKREIRRWMCVCVNRLAIVNHDNSRYIIRLAPINRLENAIFHIFGGRKSFGGRRIEFCTRDITCFSSSRSLLFFFFCTFLFLFSIPGENAFHVAPLPSGVCSYCCPIDVNRDIEYLVYTR